MTIVVVTFDVGNLYTNIPHTFRLEIARFHRDFVLKYGKFILQNNNMKFKNEFYNQIKGTAIGTVFAPTYVTLLMRHFEIKLCSIYTANMEKR